MADTVATRVLAAGPRNGILRLTNICDGSGEVLVPKLILNNMRLDDGVIPTKCALKEIQWSIQGFYCVQLFWDHTTDQVAALLGNGNGYMELGMLGMSPDPGGAGGTGNILLSTVNNTIGATYDITLAVVLS
jgi:hypothetical protein